MVCCGVFIFGDVGPKAAIELGQYTCLMCFSFAKSNTASNDVIFKDHAFCGYFSAVADNIAAIKYT